MEECGEVAVWRHLEQEQVTRHIWSKKQMFFMQLWIPTGDCFWKYQEQANLKRVSKPKDYLGKEYASHEQVLQQTNCNPYKKTKQWLLRICWEYQQRNQKLRNWFSNRNTTNSITRPNNRKLIKQVINKLHNKGLDQGENGAKEKFIL